MNYFLELVKYIDFRELLYAFLGAFFGFCLASRWEKKSEKKRNKQAIENIVEELQGVRGTIEKNVLSKLTDESNEIHGDKALFNRIFLLRYSFCTPIWDSMIASGKILDFKDEPYFESLVCAYTSIGIMSNNIDSLEPFVQKEIEDYTRCIKLCIVTIHNVDDVLNYFEN